MTTPVLSAIEPEGHSENLPELTRDWLRLVAIWSWLHHRPQATFDEFMAALPMIDRFVAMGQETRG